MSQVLACELQAAFPNSGLFKDETPKPSETVKEFFDRIDFNPCSAVDSVSEFIFNDLYFHDRDEVARALDVAIADLSAVRRQIHPAGTAQQHVESSSTEVC